MRILTADSPITGAADGSMCSSTAAAAGTAGDDGESGPCRPRRCAPSWRSSTATTRATGAARRGSRATKKGKKPALKVRIAPGRVEVRRRTCFSVRVTSKGRAVRRALIHLNGKGVKRTDRGGRAVLCRRFFTAGTRSIKAARGGYTSGRTKLKVTARRSRR